MHQLLLHDPRKDVRALTYADVCGRMLTYAGMHQLLLHEPRKGVRMLTYADVC